jgi:hypothetical protein
MLLFLPIGAILISLLVSAYALYKGWKHAVIRILVLFFLVSVIEQVLLCLRLLAGLPSQALQLQQMMQFVQVAGLILGWSFSFGYGQVYGWEKIKQEKWILLLTAAAGFITVFFPYGELISGLPFNTETGWIFKLGLRGQLFYVYMLLGSTLVLINLEKLLRSSYGRIRWQLKFAVVGIGSFFALRIYQSGNALMFNSWHQQLDGITAVGLILSCFCLVISMRRTPAGIDIYISTDVLKNSIVSLVVGSYLLGVGVLVALFRYFELDALVEQAFMIVAAFLLVLVFISDRSRQAVRHFTAHHFRRPSYDYRILWNRFNNSVSTVFDENRIARDVVRMISETLQLNVVAIWTYDSSRRNFTLAASSATPDDSWKNISSGDFEKLMIDSSGIIDLEGPGEFFPEMDGFRKSSGCQFLLPLKGKDNLLGFLGAGQKVRHRPVSLEDRELLDVLGQQTANVLLNVSLFRKMAEVSEVEAFRNMSAFLLHDMKNLANQLSLTVQNLPLYYDNEEFRNDALGVLSESVDRIKRMSSGMVMLKEELKVEPAPENINEFVRSILAEMRSEIGTSIGVELQDVPLVKIDREQMRKVLVNLLLNARDAVQPSSGGEFPGEPGGPSGGSGEPPDGKSHAGFLITVVTLKTDKTVILEVRDRGCGMTDDFIRDRLFQAFQTTKHQGMGVGLFQSRMIVEAHKGRIEVESKPGQGSTFRVYLPSASR